MTGLARQLRLNVDTDEKRKARGAFFTPRELSDFVVRWALRSATDRVLEPSCGEAAFLLPAAERLKSLGASSPDLHGVDLHEPSVDGAERLLREGGFRAELSVGDFFQVPATPTFDAVVGNPPYVRYQDFAGDARERGLRAAEAQGVKLDGLSNIWAAFVVHAATCLRPDGRLGMVLPATLLTAKYAAPVRKFLLSRFAQVGLVMFEERVFPGVQEEVVLLLAEGAGGCDLVHLLELRNASQLHEIDFRARAQPTPVAGAKWTSALLASPGREAFASVAGGELFGQLGDWGRVDLGMVTGNNKYFMMSPAQAAERGLADAELLRVCPAGARHLPGTSFSDRAWKGLGRNGNRTLLFYPTDEPSDAAREYIQQGEDEGVHEAYKCRVRTPWWRVPLVTPPHLFFTYMSGVAPRLVSNRARARHVNSLHGIVLERGKVSLGQAWLPLAALNSVTLLGAELVGRSYGGGVLKVEPREAVRLPVPTPEALDRCRDDLRVIRDQVATELRTGNIARASKKVDSVMLVRGLGIKRESLRHVRKALAQLRDRRGRRGRK